MKNLVGKVVIPASLVVASLGLSMGKYLFWFSAGDRHLRVRYYSTTTFSAGSNAMLAKGLDVSVVGTFAGTSTSMLKAASINA